MISDVADVGMVFDKKESIIEKIKRLLHPKKALPEPKVDSIDERRKTFVEKLHVQDTPKEDIKVISTDNRDQKIEKNKIQMTERDE